jgi:ubiquinone/menaquinone biosynthesis C-methylase UbiE
MKNYNNGKSMGKGMSRQWPGELLCCPGSNEPLNFLPTVISSGEMKSGYIISQKTGELVGEIDEFRYDFLHYNKDVDIDEIKSLLSKGELPRQQDIRPKKVIYQANHPAIEYIGDWKQIGEGWRYADSANGVARAVLKASIQAFEVFLITHPWSGKVRIRVDNSADLVWDLYLNTEEQQAISLTVDIDLPPKEHTIEITCLGERNSKALGQQVILQRIETLSDEDEPYRFERKVANLVNIYPPRLDQLLNEMPPDGVMLDCGSGNRRHADERYLGFEYEKCELADVFGDGHLLPFKSNSFDLVLSQAVMEHVYDPFKAADEIYRVTKPGGKVYVESAFMQPLHAVPYHYFNTTLWGLETLFKKFKIVDTDWFGNLSTTLEWMIRLTSITKQVGRERVDRLIEEIRQMEKHVTREELHKISSGVSILGIKE